MTLLDLISTIDENVERVNVYLNDELVTFYDGKNSVDDRYNDFALVAEHQTEKGFDLFIR